MSDNLKFFGWCLLVCILSVGGLALVDGPNEPKPVRPVFVMAPGMLPTGMPVFHAHGRIPNRMIWMTPRSRRVWVTQDAEEKKK